MLSGVSNECKIYDQINLGTYWQNNLRKYCSGDVTFLCWWLLPPTVVVNLNQHLKSALLLSQTHLPCQI